VNGQQIWSVLLALTAALAYAAGAVLQQRAAFPARRRPGQELTGDGALIMSVMMRSPMWISGMAMDAAGSGVEFLVLRAGSVTLVGPLILALPLGAVISHHRLRARDLAAGSLVCLSLAGFGLSARPKAGGGPAPD
jgi:drug/metabolite transporter (DMT)-like permease